MAWKITKSAQKTREKNQKYYISAWCVMHYCILQGSKGEKCKYSMHYYFFFIKLQTNLLKSALKNVALQATESRNIASNH